MKTQLCTLKPPANCEHRIDGRLSHTILCGNNSLSDSFKNCPYKQIAEIVFTSGNNDCTATAEEPSPKSPQEINFGGWHLCRKCQKPVTNGKKCSNCGDF